MKNNNILGLLNRKKVVFFVIFAFAWFQFSLADENTLNRFEDSDGDDLSNQEEQAIETDPNNADTDGDGWSDGVEFKSGFDPLVKDGAESEPVLGESEEVKTNKEDVLVEATNEDENKGESPTNTKESNTEDEDAGEVDEEANATVILKEETNKVKPKEVDFLKEVAVNKEILETIAESGENEKYSLTEDEVKDIVATTIQKANLGQELEIIPEEELNIQEEVTGDDEVSLEEEKKNVEEYFVKVGYIIFEEAPFLFKDSGNMVGVATTLITGMGNDMEDGESSNITDIKSKTGAIYEKVKELEVPYVLKDIHKIGLSLQKYMLGQDETLTTDKDDPVALTSMLGKIQAVMSEADVLGEDTLGILDQFDIDAFDISDITGSVDMQEMMDTSSMYGL